MYQQTKAEIPKTEIDMLLKPKNEERIDIECNHQTFFSFLFAVVVENKRNKIERYSIFSLDRKWRVTSLYRILESAVRC
jgi:hypothetical protein